MFRGVHRWQNAGLNWKRLREEAGTLIGFLQRRLPRRVLENGAPLCLCDRVSGGGIAEEDDPILTQYRPQKRIGEGVNEGSSNMGR